MTIATKASTFFPPGPRTPCAFGTNNVIVFFSFPFPAKGRLTGPTHLFYSSGASGFFLEYSSVLPQLLRISSPVPHLFSPTPPLLKDSASHNFQSLGFSGSPHKFFYPGRALDVLCYRPLRPPFNLIPNHNPDADFHARL